MEANLLRLKEEMEHESVDSDDESIPISSMKVENLNELAGRQKVSREMSAYDPRKRAWKEAGTGKSKTLSKTLDIAGSKLEEPTDRKVEKQESLRDIIANNKMSLQWRKERIKEYGRVKKRPKKATTSKGTSTEKKKKLEIRKINNKFAKDQMLKNKRSNVQTPRKTVTGEYESCTAKPGERSKSRNSYEWLLENPETSSGMDRTARELPRRFDSEWQHQEIKRQFKLATGDQNVTLKKMRKDKEKKDQHFANLLKKNANTNTNNQSQDSHAEDYTSETSIRMRRKQMRKADLRKRLDLDRLKNLNSKMQKRNSLVHTAREAEEVEDAPREKGRVRLTNRKKTRSEGGSRLLKGLNSKFAVDSSQSKKSQMGTRDFSIEIKMPEGKSSWNLDPNTPIISELGSGNDLMVKNRLLDLKNSSEKARAEKREINTIPEFEELGERFSGERKKEQYRRDRIKEYGQRLKTLTSHDKVKRRKVNAKEFLENL